MQDCKILVVLGVTIHTSFMLRTEQLLNEVKLPDSKNSNPVYQINNKQGLFNLKMSK